MKKWEIKIEIEDNENKIELDFGTDMAKNRLKVYLEAWLCLPGQVKIKNVEIKRIK